MIHKLIIKDKSKLFHNYVEDLDLPTEIEFKPGLNILVGPNGCGKTIILNIIRRYTHCLYKYVSTPENTKNLVNWKGIFQDGADLIADYNKPIFNLRDSKDLSVKDKSLENFQNFTQRFTSLNSSSGEDKNASMITLFKVMFEEDHVSKFSLLDKFGDEIQKYYNRNHVSGNQYTILMDEPDTNLDVNKLLELYGMLSHKRPDTQIIVVLHNPALIYKLEGNFIEFTPGYLEKIKNFITK